MILINAFDRDNSLVARCLVIKIGVKFEYEISEDDSSVRCNAIGHNEMFAFHSVINLNYMITPASISVSLIYPTRV